MLYFCPTQQPQAILNKRSAVKNLYLIIYKDAILRFAQNDKRISPTTLPVISTETSVSEWRDLGKAAHYSLTA